MAPRAAMEASISLRHLRNRADLFERHGGHAQAAGFTIANANIEELRKHLLSWHENTQSPIEALTENTETS